MTTLYFAAPAAARTASPAHQPVQIPFDGPYWYFEPPDDAPGPLAHQARGLPTDQQINLSSADGGLLRMEAMQRLVQPIELKDFGAVQVDVMNGERHSGEIELGVVLSDTTKPGNPSVILGFRPLASSEAPLPSAAAREDSVRLPVPASGTLRRFNRITVILLPTLEHDRGAKIAIQGFTLLPR